MTAPIFFLLDTLIKCFFEKENLSEGVTIILHQLLYSINVTLLPSKTFNRLKNLDKDYLLKITLIFSRWIICVYWCQPTMRMRQDTDQFKMLMVVWFVNAVKVKEVGHLLSLSASDKDFFPTGIEISNERRKKREFLNFK